METPPAASTTCPSSCVTSVDSTCCTRNAGKRPRADATASSGCSGSSPSCKLVCHEDLRQKIASPPHLTKPVDDECPAQRRGRCPPAYGSCTAEDANTRSVLRTMMAQELEQRCAPLVGDRLRWGSSIIYMVSKAYHLETSSHAFGLAISLLHRALSLPTFRDQAALDPALPLACCSLGIKWECGAGPKISHVCDFVAESMGIVIQDQALVQMELSLVEALKWSIDAVTPSLLLTNLLALSRPTSMPNLRNVVNFFLKVYYMYIAPHAAHRPSTVVQAIFAAVAGLSPTRPHSPAAAASDPEPPVDSERADYHLILSLLVEHTKADYTSPLLRHAI
ncbi:hypothetical protein T484DRAFT_3134244, partial [Baffinella frigidus]